MANAEQAPAMASPVRTDEQIVPRNRWVPIGKSNCYLNEEKSQPNPIFKIAVDILKQTNFFRAFTASSTIPAIYIQQFWDTICFDSKAGSYKCQLDEQWFNLTQDTLRDALQITPVDNNRAFSSPPTPDTLVEFVNKLGYPKEVIHLSNVTTNDMFQPWRALTTIINLCLTGKTSGFERPRAPVLQILWGVVNQAHIDYAERMWEEFTQSIHTFTEDKRKLAQHTLGKKKATLILIPSIRSISSQCKGKPNKKTLGYNNPMNSSMMSFEEQTTMMLIWKKLQSINDEFVDEGVPAAKPSLEDTEEEILQKVLEESLTDAYPTQRGPPSPPSLSSIFFPPLTFILTRSGIERLPVRPKVLLNLQLQEKKSSAETIPYLHRLLSTFPEQRGREDSTSLYAELGLYGSDTESDEEMPSVVRSGAPRMKRPRQDQTCTRDEGHRPGTKP
ncbi:hypothetical protein Tco_1490741 [Tanacetum coccineum]